MFVIKSYGRENPTEQYLNPKVIRKLVFLGRKKFTIFFYAKCFVLDITIIYCFRWMVGDILMKCGQELWFMFISDIEKQNIQNTDNLISFCCSLWNALFWEQWGYCSNFENLEIRKRIIKLFVIKSYGHKTLLSNI